jgi:hypothetical protein
MILNKHFPANFVIFRREFGHPAYATARTLANNVAELCYREEVVIIGKNRPNPTVFVATLPAALQS